MKIAAQALSHRYIPPRGISSFRRVSSRRAFFVSLSRTSAPWSRTGAPNRAMMSRLELARKRHVLRNSHGPRRMYAGTMLDYHIDDEPDIVGASMCVWRTFWTGWGSWILYTCMRVVNVLCVGKYVVMYGLAFAFVRPTFVCCSFDAGARTGVCVWKCRRLVFANTHLVDWDWFREYAWSAYLKSDLCARPRSRTRPFFRSKLESE